MRVATLLFSLLVGTTAFLSTTPTHAVAINLRSNDKSSSLGVLAASVEQVHTSTLEVNNQVEKINSTTIVNKAKDKAEDYHELPEWARYSAGVGGIILGLTLGLFGYQFIRTTIFAVCAFVCGSLMYGVLEGSLAADVENRVVIVYGSAAVVGIIFGAIFLYYTKIAFFFIGASLGIMIAVVIDPVALRYIWTDEPVLNLYLWMAVFGVITGSLTLCLEKPMFVISTSVVGSFVFMLSIAAFAGGLEVLSTYKEGDPVPDQAWYFFGGFIACVLVSMCVQFCYTATSESDDQHKEYKTVK